MKQTTYPKRFWSAIHLKAGGSRLFLTSIAACILLAGCTGSPSILDPHTTEALDVANLAWLMFAIAAVVFIVVTVLLLRAVFRRRPAQDQLVAIDPPRERRTLSLVLLGGALAPAVVLIVVMALSISIQNAEASAAAASQGGNVIQVIGHQWWWEVRYPDQGIVTANEIHLPVGVPFLIKVTTADVIHSFWVPQLHGKIDMIPGQTNTISVRVDNPGNYRGECAEFCGTQHAQMDLVVVAQSRSDYDKWVAQEQKPAPDPANGSIEKQGQQAFLGSSCTYCHTISGTNASGTLGPDLTHLASRQMIGAGLLPNTPGALAGWITNAQALKPGNKMPPIDLDAVQVQQIIAYLETLK